MKTLTREEAYKLGSQARQKGFPSAPLFNKEFWELNQEHQHKEWKENIEAYVRGWSEEGKVTK